MKFSEFVKRNRFFVGLTSILLVVSLCLFSYSIINYFNINNKKSAVVTQQVDDKEEIVDAIITEFSGNFDRSNGHIALNWDYVEGKSPVKAVRLYHKDRDLFNVITYRSMNVSRDGYNIPTGDNEFTLKIIQEDEKVIEKTIQVFINYVVNLNSIVEQKNGKTYVSLEYAYESKNEIHEPSLIVLDSIGYAKKEYVNTTKKQKDDMVYAKTTYVFEWKEKPVEYREFSIRWAFEELNDSADFMVHKGENKQEGEDNV